MKNTCCSHETHTACKDRFKVKTEKTFQPHPNPKKVWVSTLISEKHQKGK